MFKACVEARVAIAFGIFHFVSSPVDSVMAFLNFFFSSFSHVDRVRKSESAVSSRVLVGRSFMRVWQFSELRPDMVFFVFRYFKDFHLSLAFGSLVSFRIPSWHVFFF